MTSNQESHLEAIKQEFLLRVDQKYRAGVVEHGGNLWQNPTIILIEEAMNECVDKFAYLATAREQLLGVER